MVRSYLRHGATQAFGIITSPTANSHFDSRLAYVPGWEDVLVWDIKLGEMVSMWHSPSLTSQITHIVPSPQPDQSTSASPRTFAVAYQDGSIRLWSYDSKTPREEAAEMVTFNGHKKAITTMGFDRDGSRLASGGTEGEVVIWDRVAEVGLFRLKGHRGPVTSIHFIPHPTLPTNDHPGYLLTTAKDTYLKLWDLGTQHCLQTIVVGRGEVLSCDVLEEDEDGGIAPEEDGEERAQTSGRWVVLTGSGDGEAKAWSVEKQALVKGLSEGAAGDLPTLIEPLCALPLPSSTHPVTQVSFHPTQPVVLLQTSDRTTTILRLRTAEEITAKRSRRKKRDKEKQRKRGTGAAENGDGAELNDDTEANEINGTDSPTFLERIATWCMVRTNAKVRSFAFPEDDGGSTRNGFPLLLQLSNNSLESYLIPSPTSRKKLAEGASPEPTKTHSLDLPGHRQDIRTLSISLDDQVIASAASGTLKIWNARTTACLRTMECGYAICSAFLPGDRHVVLGTKHGDLQLFDIASSSLLSTYTAHTGPVWGIHVRTDGRGLVTGSADKDVKFWDFEVREEDDGERVVSRLGVETIHKSKQLALVHVRTLKMTDDVLAVKYSPDGRFLAVSLLDSTVKIFFQDSLKFFLSLYGHKLPVLSLDISSDSKLIVTSSADKNVKIWGLDFGDCHKSIFAHDDSIMQVAFERNSHFFWTVGKDRLLKYWDGDKFELIQKLEGHHGEIWALAVSNQATYVVTGSHDKSIRIWEKTDEPLFLEEERELEIEQAFDSNLADSLNRDPNPADGDDLEEVDAVRKQTSETLMAGERISEALELADADRTAIRDWEAEKAKVPIDVAGTLPRPSRNAELIARGDLEADEHVLRTLQKIPTASMEDALLTLPFGQVVSLLGYLDEWARKDRDIILTTRLLTFLLRTHSSQLIANRTLRPTLLALRSHVRNALQRHRQTIGYNLAALKFLKNRYEGEQVAGMMEEANWDEEKVRERMEKGRAKRKRVGVMA